MTAFVTSGFPYSAVTVCNDDYDWRLDAYKSWELALSTIRARKILEGAIVANDDGDQAWFERMRRRANGD